MNTIPFITVLLPVYNCEKYIAEAIDSILQQTYTHFELLIIDDCSTDATLQICKSFQDERIVIIEKEKNSGYTNSLNYGIGIAKGKYIARMDGDDISLPTRFEKQVAFMEANEDVVVCGTLYKIIGTEKISDHPFEHDEIKVKLISGCYIAHPTVMLRTEFFKSQNIKYDEKMEPAEDYELWSRLAFICKLANINEVLLEYRVHEKQVSALRNEKQKKVTQNIKIKMLQKISPKLSLKAFSPDVSLLLNNPIIFYFKIKENVLMWNVLLKENNKNQIYNSIFFEKLQKTEKGILFNLIYKKSNLITIKMIFDILFVMPEFFKHIGIHKSIKFIVKCLNSFLKIQIIKVLSFFGVKHNNRNFFIKLKNFYYNYCTITGIRQLLNYKSIPIIIISFNQLNYLKKLIDFLKLHNYNNIVIVDNNSTYQPLLNYFDQIKNEVCIYKLSTNEGHLVFWKNKELFKKYSKGYYVVTDSDIVPINNCPSDFLYFFKKILDEKQSISKVGFSLNIDNIPDTNSNKQKILNWETKFWNKRDENNNYIAPIDTTFALYKPRSLYIEKDEFYKAIRTKYPYMAEHGGWYVDSANLTEEQSYYYKTANSSSSWKPNENGEVEKSLYNII